MREVIHRFNEIGPACLDPRWTGGRPRLLKPHDEDFVVQRATTRPTRLGQPFTRWSIRAARPDGAPIHIVLDNLSAHTGADIRRWAKKNKVELCFTPTYASWANPIEAHFGPLRQFTLAHSNHRSHPAQTQALHRYLHWRNANARHPDVLAAQRRERARIRSEKGIRWGGRPIDCAALLLNSPTLTDHASAPIAAAGLAS